MKRIMIISGFWLLALLLFPHQAKADLYCGGTMICPDGSPRSDPAFNTCSYVASMGCVLRYSGTILTDCSAKTGPYRCTYLSGNVRCPDAVGVSCPPPGPENWNYSETDCCSSTSYTCTSAAAPVCNGSCPSGQSCKPNSGNSACECWSSSGGGVDLYPMLRVLIDNGTDNALFHIVAAPA